MRNYGLTLLLVWTLEASLACGSWIADCQLDWTASRVIDCPIPQGMRQFHGNLGCGVVWLMGDSHA